MSVTVILTHMQRIVRTFITVRKLFSISPQLTQLYLFKDTAAVIQMIMRGRSPSWRHGTRTHGVDLDGLFQRTDSHHSVVLVFVRTHDRLANFVLQGVVFPQNKGRHYFCCERFKPTSTAEQFRNNSLIERCSIHVERKPRHSHECRHLQGALCVRRGSTALGRSRRSIEEEWAQYSSRCLVACCTLSKLRAAVEVRNQTCSNVQDKMERHAGMRY